MADKTKERRTERNLLLIEWSMAIVGMFWGVWWSFFLQDVLAGPESFVVESIVIPKSYYLTLSVFTTAWFIYYFVRWSWSLRQLSLYSNLKTALNRIRPLLLMELGVCGAIWITAIGFKINIAQAAYGITLTLLWPVLIFSIIVFSEEE